MWYCNLHRNSLYCIYIDLLRDKFLGHCNRYSRKLLHNYYLLLSMQNISNSWQANYHRVNLDIVVDYKHYSLLHSNIGHKHIHYQYKFHDYCIKIQYFQIHLSQLRPKYWGKLFDCILNLGILIYKLLPHRSRPRHWTYS